MKLKVRSAFISTYPVWRVIDDTGREIEFYDREQGMHKGLTREELIKLLREKGYEVSGK